MSRDKQIDGSTLAVLNCYRNKYYTDGNATEQGLVANAINDVLPYLVELKNGGYRKASDVAREIFGDIDKFLKSQEALSENKRLKEVGDWIFHEYLPSQLAKLKKKYESEGADDE